MSIPTSHTGAVCPPVLVAVVTAAGRRCECTRPGCHGRSQRWERTLPPARLLTAPRDVTVPTDAAWRLSVEELAAWCQRCHDHALAEARRPRRAVLRAESPAVLRLFDVPAVTR
jgi:hypothetical protein